MNSREIKILARNKYRKLKRRFHAKYGGINKANQTLNNDIAKLQQIMSAHDDENTKQNIISLSNKINNDKKLLQRYELQLQDKKFIVIMLWSENDLADSNNSLIDDQEMKSWQTVGCKAIGKLGPNPHAQNAYENHGYFASFNYPINIVKAPSVYYYSMSELQDLYESIGAHNPKLAPILVRMAKAGTISVYKFKYMFGLTLKQLNARLKRLKMLQNAKVPNFTVNDLQKYYQWELQHRSNDNTELSQYDPDYDQNFNTTIQNYKTQGNGASDETGPNNAINGVLTQQDYDAGQEYDDPNQNQWNSDGTDFGLNSDSDLYPYNNRFSDDPSSEN